MVRLFKKKKQRLRGTARKADGKPIRVNSTTSEEISSAQKRIERPGTGECASAHPRGPGASGRAPDGTHPVTLRK